MRKIDYDSPQKFVDPRSGLKGALDASIKRFGLDGMVLGGESTHGLLDRFSRHHQSFPDNLLSVPNELLATYLRTKVNHRLTGYSDGFGVRGGELAGRNRFRDVVDVDSAVDRVTDDFRVTMDNKGFVIHVFPGTIAAHGEMRTDTSYYVPDTLGKDEFPIEVRVEQNGGFDFRKPPFDGGISVSPTGIDVSRISEIQARDPRCIDTFRENLAAYLRQVGQCDVRVI